MKITEKTSNIELFLLRIYHSLRWFSKKILDAINFIIFSLDTKKQFNKKEIKRVLVINFQGIGDLVMMTSLLESLKYEFGQIDLLCNGKNGEIFSNDSKIKIISHQNLFKSSSIVRRRYDLVICPYRAEHAGFLTAISNSKYKIGYVYSIQSCSNFKTETHGIHNILSRNPRIKADNIRKSLHLKEVVQYDSPYITIGNATKEKISKLLKKYQKKNIIVFNCNNNWISKSWPKQKWIELGKKFTSNKDNVVLLIGTEADKKFNDEITKEIKSKNAINISGKFNLVETIELLKHANIFITTDSGPMHMGFVAKTPKIISLFGSTNPDDFIIDKYKKDVLWKNRDGKICPLWNYNNEPITNNNLCMSTITVEDVIGRVK